MGPKWFRNRPLASLNNTLRALGASLSNTLRGVGAFQHSLSNTHPMVWGLPGLFKQHPPSVWGLPALSKRHPTKTWRPMVATTGAEWLGRPSSNPLRQVWATTLKNHNLIHFFTQLCAAGFCLFKRDPPRGLPRLSETLRGFRGWPVATPRAEGGRGEVNLPIEALTRPTEGRRIYLPKCPLRVDFLAQITI